ncbi:FtsW/RodA/SpoVE family cell cycle protein [[Clostridium] colinum]|uniref:FtsW/RodA/SpoVE family cell cycle protein n=1 Tax=[Clostridium] colinum TaxID=36835 RepID=UPI0020244C7D|nr:FtsW/RodA/SpoVE family cell cycle protein [[Clostridium] colinum]
MYEIIVNISRYIFLIYICLFLLLGFLICIGEKNIICINNKVYLLIQRLIIFFFHTSAFTILSFNKETRNIDFSIVPFFILTLIFIIFGNFVASLFYKNSCHLIWNGIFFLMSIGITTLYRLNHNLAKRQFAWFILGFCVCLAIPILLNILPRLNLFKYLYLFMGLSLLLATLLVGIEDGGAKNWISIKGITFQPSELVKLLFIFYLSSCFSSSNLKIKNLIFPSIMSLIFIVCLVFQTDLGSALIFFMTYLVMLYISTSKTWLILLGIFLAYLGSMLGYNLFNHVRVRVEIWLNPWSDISNKGYQIAQSLFAIGTYGFMGSGLNMGMPQSIPVVERDLIFSAICEEFGLFFGIGLILIFIMIFYRSVKISLNSQNKFLSLLSSGMTSLMCFQTFLIIGGATKLIPLTGVTLPFISYGGSSIIISFTIIGILQWVSIRNTKYNILTEEE